MTLSDQDLQVHKFLKDAHDMLGTVDNLLLDRTNVDRGSAAIPDVGNVRQMAAKLAEKLHQLIS